MVAGGWQCSFESWHGDEVLLTENEEIIFSSFVQAFCQWKFDTY